MSSIKNGSAKPQKINKQNSKEQISKDVAEPMEIDTENHKSDSINSNRKELEESVLILQTSQEKILEILDSDDNEVDKMPPPLAPPKKSKTN